MHIIKLKEIIEKSRPYINKLIANNHHYSQTNENIESLFKNELKYTCAITTEDEFDFYVEVFLEEFIYTNFGNIIIDFKYIKKGNILYINSLFRAINQEFNRNFNSVLSMKDIKYILQKLEELESDINQVFGGLIQINNEKDLITQK